jgi:myo-inositol-hexaphosphate 3-phosphohydrolase
MRIRVLSLISGLTLLFSALVVLVAPAAPGPVQAAPLAEFDPMAPDRRQVTNVDFLGALTFTTNFSYQQTQVGGLSGLTYDAKNDLYYALSDDRSQLAPARFYTLAINIADGRLENGDVSFEGLTTLLDGSGKPFPEAGVDPEGIALTQAGTLFISSEGDAGAKPPIGPFVNEFSLKGQQLRALPVPEKFLPSADGATGIRNNLAFESLTLTPNEKFLYVATENALAQDGPVATLETGSLTRVIKYDLATGQPVQEMVYEVGTVAQAPNPATEFSTNGLVEMLALDNNGSFLALERSFSTGLGNTIKLYQARTQGALDVSTQESLVAETGEPFEMDPPIAKRLLLDLSELGLTLDNLEGLTFGPLLADGRQTLMLVSDNNFSETQVTQFVALALTLETIPVVLPTIETPYTVDSDEPPAQALPGDSDDPAIWVHPTDPDQSLVLATLKDGGLAVFDLAGKTLETMRLAAFGDIRYNNVDLVYGFELEGQQVDLAVASDRANDTLAIFKIDPKARRLSDVTAPDILESIFGEDDGEKTAYGLATYTSPISGQTYAFVTQREGNLLAHLELTDNGSGLVQAKVVRILELPALTGNPEDSQSEGLVVDRELGFFYVALEGGFGIFKYGAEPNAGDEPLRSLDTRALLPDVEGLTIYYGPNGAGYLLASSQGDSSFAIFERAGDNTYLGSFVVGDNNTIDQANESDGADVINVALGAAYPSGLLVVQDGANEPQFAVPDEEQLENSSTNFKFVPWENVAAAFPEPLLIDPTSYTPR